MGWILSTISDEVSDLVISSVSTASDLWKVIHDLFHDNKNTRAMQLEHEFRTTVKGNTTMAAYCQHLQNLADWLDDIDAPMSQHQLVLQMLRGLPADLQAQTSFLQFQDPLPTFLQARSALMLLDRQRSPMADTGSTALLAGRPGANSGGRQPSSGSSGGAQHGGSFHGSGLQHGGSYGEGSSFGQRNGYGRGGGRGNGSRGRGRGRQSSSRQRTYPSGPNAWNSPHPNHNSGLLGPRPMSTPHPLLALVC
ncbi:unnamed protein product [Cuscuta campestris]|uniref:Retrotransposon gag domain-containing protein n=1 Tax=Cuscuta campestris TaxID=132261 RepID=A0A484LTK0_9ASTE|nr:unnamed protein product [Cuscuta campestris]